MSSGTEQTRARTVTRARSAMPGAQNLLALSVYHESIEPFAYAQGDRLYIRLRIGRNLASGVEVVHCDKFLADKTTAVAAASHYALDGDQHELFQAELVSPTKRFKYFFRISVHEQVSYFSRRGLTENAPSWDDAFEVPYLGERDQFDAPSWAEGAIYYQVFPDRFARDDTVPSARKWSKWNAVPSAKSYFGGNLSGILAKLDHLTELGVNVLYMTPIFLASSNHKYDTIDYFRVDPDFGTEDELRTLVEECHQRGIRVVLDAVFNHMGSDNPIFLDILKRGPESPYADWIYPSSWPLSKKKRNYETFAYAAHMPKWRTATPEVETYLIDVARYWIEKTGIDGWRLDVSDEVEHTFWRHLRQSVKHLKHDALICGEIWQVATPWLRGDQFDAVMNYPFTRAVLDWLGKGVIDATGFDCRIEQIRAQYPENVLPYLWSLLDSHDTPRLLDECRFNRRQADLAMFVQFTAVGSPVIYYGDEVGMTGGKDPLCRGGMLWEKEDQDRTVFEHYKRLVNLRRTHASLRQGAYRPLFRGISRQLYGYLRQATDPDKGVEETTFCVLNNADGPVGFTCSDALLPGGLYKAIYGHKSDVFVKAGDTLTIPGKSAIAFLRTEDEHGS